MDIKEILEVAGAVERLLKALATLIGAVALYKTARQKKKPTTRNRRRR